MKPRFSLIAALFVMTVAACLFALFGYLYRKEQSLIGASREFCCLGAMAIVSIALRFLFPQRSEDRENADEPLSQKFDPDRKRADEDD